MLQKENASQFTESIQTASDQAKRPEGSLLDNVIAQSARAPSHADGIAIGVLDAFNAEGKALVSIAAFGLTGVAAHTLVPLTMANLGAQLALGFESSNPQRPIIIGLILSGQPHIAPSGALRDSAPESPADEPGADQEPQLDVIVDGRYVVLEAEREIELRCGEAALILSADGRIQLRGTYITSHASATQRILGGSVNVN